MLILCPRWVIPIGGGAFSPSLAGGGGIDMVLRVEILFVGSGFVTRSVCCTFR
jgi:hypothetical protein